MAGKIANLISDFSLFAWLLWRFSDEWQMDQIQYLDTTTIVLQVILIILTASALTSSATKLVRAIGQRRREKEENRIGPDL